MISHFSNHLFAPTFSSLLKDRTMSVMIIGVSIAQVTLTALSLPAWQCPLLSGLNCPCPGCGLTRAVIALISGDFRTAFSLHIFAPALLIALLFIFANVLFPKFSQLHLIPHIETLETKTGITNILLFSLVAYWLIRLLFFSESYVMIIMS